ncbi:hypothetical protein BSU04_36655 [Caballeronia sordidicola]|uniref:Uncharacterized protein n=1 Tax=Caballeronia sordidicola TaxID=196367 RepID=A0A226WQJ1_CABSO|nr:hypothetical protein BSU04_45295 [Caballeronia sordidicola]OXC73442.1 hypothetical protein BSU04_36655 [Caballeronia sordidicola]
MRWADEVTHCMAQVKVAVFNGRFSLRRISAHQKAAAPQMHRAATMARACESWEARRDSKS